MKKDYQTKKGRLKKRDYKVDFNLTEGDDSWGFEESPLKLRATISIWEKILYTIIFAYFVYYIIQALTYII